MNFTRNLVDAIHLNFLKGRFRRIRFPGEAGGILPGDSRKVRVDGIIRQGYRQVFFPRRRAIPDLREGR